MGRGFLGIVVLVAACIAGPAHGDATYGSTTGVNGVLFNDCLNHPYGYSLNVPADAQDWYLDTTLVGPGGQVASNDRVASEQTAGTSTFFVCTRPDGFGGYTIRSTFHWLPPEPEAAWQESTLDDSSFRLRAPSIGITNVSFGDATVQGMLEHATTATGWVEWGASTNELTRSDRRTYLAGSGWTTSRVSIVIWPLEPERTYVCRLVASNDFGITRSGVVQVTLAAAELQ
jgi:hypothetical protein